MEIRAKCKFDFESIKALTYFSAYKNTEPKKSVIARIIICLALIVVIIAELFIFESIVIPIILICLDLFVLFMDVIIYFVYPKLQYKNLVKMQNVVNNYVFGDESLKVFTEGNEYNGEAEMEYSLFVKVCETKKYFFLYQTKSQVFMVDKSTITGGTSSEIRAKLLDAVGDKYSIFK